MKLNHRKFCLGGMFVCLVGVMATLAACQPRSPEARVDWIASKITSELKLDDVQKSKLEALKKEVLALHGEQKGERAGHLKALTSQIRADKLDRKTLEGLHAERAAQFDRHLDRLFPLISDFHASLTREQKDKLASHIEEMAAKFHGKE